MHLLLVLWDFSFILFLVVPMNGNSPIYPGRLWLLVEIAAGN